MGGDKVSENVTAGKKISIDEKDTVKRSSYFGGRIYLIIGALVTLVLGVVLFIYRKTKVGGKIIEILKVVVISFWKIIKLTLLFIVGVVRKILKKKK